jgi:hypothetical protein
LRSRRDQGDQVEQVEAREGRVPPQEDVDEGGGCGSGAGRLRTLHDLDADLRLLSDTELLVTVSDRRARERALWRSPPAEILATARVSWHGETVVLAGLSCQRASEERQQPWQ